MSERELNLVLPQSAGPTNLGADPYILTAKARELSELLAESEAVREYAAAEEAMLNDEEALRLLKEADEAKAYTHFVARTRDKALMDKSMEDYYKAEEAQRSHSTIHQYNDAKDRLQALLDRLNAIITYPITGTENPPGSGGGCGGCSR